MDIRTIPPEDLAAGLHISRHSFFNGEDPEYDLEDLRRERLIGVYAESRLQATLGVMPLEMYFGQDRRSVGGVTSVMCDPSSRGRGYAGALVKRGLELMRDRGECLASLWPFNFKFYQAYGWDWTGVVRNNMVPLRLLQSEKESRFIEGVYENPIETITPVYEALAMRYNGALVRDATLWKWQFERPKDRKPAVYVYRRDGQLEGYAILKHQEKNRKMRATCGALTMRAYRGILGLFHNHAMSVDTIGWHSPADDPLHLIVADWKVKSKLQPYSMGRIVDVPGALSLIRPGLSLKRSATIRISDDSANWNAGNWKIVIEGGRVKAKRTDAEPGLELDIRALSQAYWGTPSILELRARGLVSVSREEDFDVLSALLPEKTVWIDDEF